MRFLFLVTLTFDLDIHTRMSEGQTRLLCEFGTNPFSGSCHPLGNTIPKNRTRFADFVHLAHEWLPNQQFRLSVCLSVRPSHAGIVSKRRHVVT